LFSTSGVIVVPVFEGVVSIAATAGVAAGFSITTGVAAGAGVCAATFGVATGAGVAGTGVAGVGSGVATGSVFATVDSGAEGLSECESILGTMTNAAAIKSTAAMAAPMIQAGNFAPPPAAVAPAASCKAVPHSGQRNSAPSAIVTGFFV
jgi:hypothetical protein